MKPPNTPQSVFPLRRLQSSHYTDLWLSVVDGDQFNIICCSKWREGIMNDN